MRTGGKGHETLPPSAAFLILAGVAVSGRFLLWAAAVSRAKPAIATTHSGGDHHCGNPQWAAAATISEWWPLPTGYHSGRRSALSLPPPSFLPPPWTKDRFWFGPARRLPWPPSNLHLHTHTKNKIEYHTHTHNPHKIKIKNICMLKHTCPNPNFGLGQIHLTIF